VEGSGVELGESVCVDVGEGMGVGWATEDESPPSLQSSSPASVGRVEDEGMHLAGRAVSSFSDACRPQVG